MFGIPEDQVTPEQKDAAKKANFLLLYGGSKQSCETDSTDTQAPR